MAEITRVTVYADINDITGQVDFDAYRENDGTPVRLPIERSGLGRPRFTVLMEVPKPVDRGHERR